LAPHRPLLTLALAALLGAVAAPFAAAPPAGPGAGPTSGAAARARGAGACAGCHAPHHQDDGTCVACHRGRPDTDRAELAHHRLLRGAAAAWGLPGAPELDEGERLRAAGGCRRCHVSGGEGNPLAIPLDDVVWRRTQEELRASILAPVSAMPDFGFDEGQADRLIAVLLRDARGRPARERYVVRFREAAAGRRHPFERHCGPCHRALTRDGPLGTGTSGADLSGLLTPHYPPPDGRRWDRARLERWLRNPREEHPNATMPPVAVEAADLDGIVTALGPARRDST
jgi:mono/diheme cytochrome c family protein